MLISGKMKYKKAVILTEDKMHELETLLHKYCDSISYKAETINDSEIAFSSLDELLQYDNFESRSLKTLQISAIGVSGYHVRLYFEVDCLFLGITGYDETFHCYYEVSTVDGETTLREEINTFLRKITAEYWLLAKFRVSSLLVFFCYIAIIYLLSHKISTNSNTDIGFSLMWEIIGIVLGIILIFLVRLVDQHFLQRCFPPIAFVWGEGKTQFEKNQKLRANLFWGLIMAVIAGIIATFISNIIL